MGYDDDYLRELLIHPRESLSVELKQWIDPSSKQGRAIIAKACMAMYNNNGGVLIIGFKNDCIPDIEGEAPNDIRAAFHQDTIQGIVTKYSSKPFEVEVKFVERNGKEYPILCIQAGVRAPVAAKSGLDSEDNPPKALIVPHQVYVRTLSANNVPSTSQAKCEDWDRIVELCFENREANIGRFFRRHLSAVEVSKIKEIITSVTSESAVYAEPGNTLAAKCDDAYRRFAQLASAADKSLLDVGNWEVGFTIIGDIPHYNPNREFIDKMLPTNPNYTGWPIWVDSRHFSEETQRPIQVDGGWQCFIPPRRTGVMFSFDDLDFWRIEPPGFFYALRGIEDDLSTSKKNPHDNTLDWGIMIYRVSEALVVASSFAKALGCTVENTVLKYRFKWRKLNGRKLCSWVERSRHMNVNGTAHQDSFEYGINIPLETALSAIHEYSASILNRLFEVFDGINLELDIYEYFTQRMLSKRR